MSNECSVLRQNSLDLPCFISPTLYFIHLRSTHLEQQDLDLTSEPLSKINQRLTNFPSVRSASFTLTTANKTLDLPLSTKPLQTSFLIDCNTRHVSNGRSRHTGPLTATTNQIYNSSRHEHHSQMNSNTRLITECDRTFIHHSDCRPFKLGTAIQMKPADDVLIANGRRRPCHRQNALRYKSNDQEQNDNRFNRSITKSINPNQINLNENSSTNISRHQSIERRTASLVQPIKSFSFDINNELQPCDISWSVREKMKLFEYKSENKLSTGRENYV